MATRLNRLFLLATLILCISAPTSAVLIRSEDIDTLEKLEATARKYFSKGDPAQLEQSDVARDNYLVTIETLMLQAAQLTGLIPDTYMRVKKESVRKEVLVTQGTIRRLGEEREHFTSRLLQTMGVSKITTLKHKLTVAEFDEKVEAHMAYLELLETRFRLLWTDGNAKPSRHVLPNGLVTHGFVTLGYRYFVEDTQNLMFSVHPHNLRVAESLYGIFYDALLTMHTVHLKLSLPFPKAKNSSLQPRFDRFNPRDKEASLQALGIEFIRENRRYFEEKLAPLTRTVAALHAEIVKLEPPAVQEVLPPPSTLVLGREWVVVDGGMEGSPLSPDLVVVAPEAAPSLDLAARVFLSPPFSPQLSSSTRTKEGTEEVVRPLIEVPQAAPSVLVVSADRSGTASVHSFFGDDWEYDFDGLSVDSRELNAQDHVVSPADPRVPDDTVAAPSRTSSPAVTIASSLSQGEGDRWEMLDDASGEAELPSSAEPILQDGAVPPLPAEPPLNQSFARSETEAREDEAASLHSDFDLLFYDDLTVESHPLVHRTGNLVVDTQSAAQDAALALDLGLDYALHPSENGGQSGDDSSVDDIDEDGFHQDLLSRMQHHSSLRAQLAEREAALKKLDSSTRTLAEASALAKGRTSAAQEAFHALKAGSHYLSRVTYKFRSTLRSARTKTQFAAHRAKENIQSRVRRAAQLQSSLKSNGNVEPLPSSSKTPTPFPGENLEAPVSGVSQLFQGEELRAEHPLQISPTQERAPVSLGNSPAPLPYSSTPLPLPIALTEIIVPSEVADPIHYSKRAASPELLSTSTPSRIFNLNDFLIPFSSITGLSQGVGVDAPYSTRSPQAHLSYGLSSSTKHSSSDTNHVGGMRGAPTPTAFTAASGSGGASLHEPHQKASSYSPHTDTTHIQTLRKTPRYPTMRMPLPHRGNRRLFDSLVAVTA